MGGKGGRGGIPPLPFEGGGGGGGGGGEEILHSRRGQFALGQNVPRGTYSQIIRGDILRYYTGTGKS